MRLATYASLSEEHPELFAATTLAINLVHDRPNGFASVDNASVWAQHYDFAQRAAELGEHLTSALQLAEQARYPGAYSLLRTALEHQAVDRLLLLATQFRSDVGPIDDTEFARLRAEFEAGSAAWTRDVTSLEREGQRAVVVRRGHDVLNDDGEVVEHVSPYFVVLERHNATLGPPRVQPHFNDGLTDPERRDEWARENQSIYRRFLRWSSILENLVLNDLLSEAESIQLDVHYRFLSAFTHATQTGYETVSRIAGSPSNTRSRNHFLEELALLYAAVISGEELRSFARFVDARPNLLLSDDADVRQAIAQIDQVTRYLWFPGGTPSACDHFHEANRRAWQAGPPFRDAVPPNEIPSSEVSYYADPLKRLIELHRGGSEATTGFGFAPLW